MLFPVQIVQQADDAPEFLVLRIEFTCEVAHRVFDRFAVLDMEFILVVSLKQVTCVLARNAGGKLSHDDPLRRRCFSEYTPNYRNGKERAASADVFPAGGSTDGAPVIPPLRFIGS